MESIGPERFVYELTAERRPGTIQEKGGDVDLWHKKPDGTWVILLWQINRLEK